MQSQWLENDGVRIHVLSGDLDKEGVLCIVVPGMLGDADSYLEVLEQMQGPRLALSLRGRGRSQAPAAGSYSFTQQGSDVLAVIDHYNRPCVLVAHSVGVAFAVWAAHERGELVRGLLLIDYPPVYPQFPPRWRDDILARLAEEDDAEERSRVVTALQAESNQELLVPQLRDFKGRLLVLAAESEALLREGEIDFYRRVIEGIRIEVLPDSSHEVAESAPAALTASMQRFCAECESAD